MWANCLKSSFFVCSSLCKPILQPKFSKKYFSCILYNCWTTQSAVIHFLQKIFPLLISGAKHTYALLQQLLFFVIVYETRVSSIFYDMIYTHEIQFHHFWQLWFISYQKHFYHVTCNTKLGVFWWKKKLYSYNFLLMQLGLQGCHFSYQTKVVCRTT